MERNTMMLIARPGRETDTLLSFLGAEPAWRVILRRPDDLRVGAVKEAFCIFLDPDERLIQRMLKTPSPFENGVLVLGSYTSELREKLSDAGIPVLGRPAALPLLREAIDLALASRSSIQRLTDENRRLQQELRNTRLISRAKFALMQYLGMSEAEAHHYIQKQAMETGVAKSVVAEEILSAYSI